MKESRRKIQEARTLELLNVRALALQNVCSKFDVSGQRPGQTVDRGLHTAMVIRFVFSCQFL